MFSLNDQLLNLNNENTELRNIIKSKDEDMKFYSTKYSTMKNK